MTHDRDFKRIVRARMTTTGESFTQARTALLAGDDRPARPAREAGAHPIPGPAPSLEAAGTSAPPVASDAAWQAARREHERVIGRFFDGERLRSVPTRRKVRASVLLELLARFRPQRDYPETEVNEILRAAHEDVAYLRRELVTSGYLSRADGIYRVAEQPPHREPSQAQELPAWEALWLPRFLAGGDPAP